MQNALNTSVTRSELTQLLEERAGPCLSLYQPTHRHFPLNQQDPIRYKNLLKTLEQSLLKQVPGREAAPLLEPLQQLSANLDFWNHTWDGLAVLSAPGFFQTFRLQRPVPEAAIVAPSFHVKPLLRIQQSADRFQVLCVNRREVRLFEGNRDALDEAELAAGVPRTIQEALGEELTEPHQTVASYGGTALGSSMRHSHGSKQEDAGIDEERFFRAVDRAVWERHSRPSGLPLILAALTQYHAAFRAVAHNPQLAAAGIEADPWALSAEQLRQRAWEVVLPQYRARLQAWADTFGEAQAKGQGSSDLSAVAQAAAQGRVRVLLAEAERHIHGILDPVSGEIRQADSGDPKADDLLDDLSELVLRRGGEVVVVPAADMPSPTGVAAIYRY